MVGVEGFEPPASCSQSRRATRLRYTPKTGPDGRIRTCDFLLPKQARYQPALHPEKMVGWGGLEPPIAEATCFTDRPFCPIQAPTRNSTRDANAPGCPGCGSPKPGVRACPWDPLRRGSYTARIVKEHPGHKKPRRFCRRSGVWWCLFRRAFVLLGSPKTVRRTVTVDLALQCVNKMP